MSDEEKKAINKLEEFIKRQALDLISNCFGMSKKEIGTIKQQEIYSIIIVLNLIEKQSKEIEELKEEKAKRQWVHIKENGEVEPLFYVSEDKIKAKIKEIDKVLNEDIYVIDGHYDDRYYRYLQDKHILQSLLEKE